MSLMDDLIFIASAGHGVSIDAQMLRLRAFIEQHEPWLPPQQEGFGPWIEYTHGKDKGPRVYDTINALTKPRRIERDATPNVGVATGFHWSGIVAYCVKLEGGE